jgi:site-specific DNA-methyltransferase (adenine-specific)
MLRNEHLQAKQSDVLEVIANLNNEQVFTPPKVANALLDLLPKEVWSDPTLRWLDPGSKTGIFPREVAKRLMVGLAEVIPDEASRLEHILKKMVFAIATEKLTGMITRRTLYCSKSARSQYSAVHFANEEGNIWHERVEHSFEKGRCSECGGTRGQLEKEGRDNYAYGFVHADGRSKIEKEMGMKFDVIVGNPPYQMDADVEGQNITPLYDAFVEQAIALNPRYISMVIPSRWTAGGKWLDGFRERMLGDSRLRVIVDFPNAEEVFPGIGKSIKGGVQYFLWDRDNPGLCATTTRRGETIFGPIDRELNQFDIFVRDSRALPILAKVMGKKEASFSEIVSMRDPFGPALSSNFNGYRRGDHRETSDLKLYMNIGGKRVQKYVDHELVTKNHGLVKKWKVLVPNAGSDGGQKLPDVVLGVPIVAEPRSVCTLTYLCIGPFDTKTECESVTSYMRTRFARFIISQRKISHHSTQNTYLWLPQQNWDHTWTDVELYKKYGITKDEQAYIETMIKEMLP